MSRDVGLRAFYVSLPQYLLPRDDTFATYNTNNIVSSSSGSELANTNNLVIIGTALAGGNPITDLFYTTFSKRVY
jgi:hypothetical protein